MSMRTGKTRLSRGRGVMKQNMNNGNGRRNEDNGFMSFNSDFNAESGNRSDGCNGNRFDEMRKGCGGNDVIDMSNSSVVNLKEISLDYIKDINTNPSKDKNVEYNDIMNPSSDYKQNLINKMLKDVQMSTQHLYGGNNNEGYERQAQQQWSGSAANSNKIKNDAKKIVNMNDL